MRLSLFYNCDIAPGAHVPTLYQEIETQALLADRLGFDALYLAEHHFHVYGRLPAPLIFLARLSGLTRHLALGTAVVEAPYYHPLRLAEDAALLDLLSGGRLRLGVGSGARNKPSEFATFGVDLDEKGPRTLEIVEVLRQALDDGLVDFTGAFYQYSDVEFNPRPARPASEIIWLAASGGTPELAGAHGFPLMIPRVGPGERHRQMIERYRAALDGRPGHVAQLRYVYVAETEAEAREQTRQMFTRYAQYDCNVAWDGRTDSAEYADLMRRMNMIIDTPARVIEHLTAWQAEYGFDELICQVHAAGMRHADSLRAIELLGQAVLPRLRTAPAPVEQLA